MKKLLLVLATVAPLVLGSSVAFAGQRNRSDAPSPSYSDTATQPPPGSTGDGGNAGYDKNAAATIIVSGSGYSPSNVTVAAGATVMWINQDGDFHTVTSSVPGGPESRRMYPGKAYSFTFTQPGTYTYHCQFHPGMTGMVTVTGVAPGADTSTPPSGQQPGAAMPSTSETPPASTSDGGSSSSSSSSATANAQVTVESAPPQGTATSSQSQAPAKTYPTELPATGVSDAVIAFGAASAVGAGVYSVYSYTRRKLIGG